MDTIRRVRTKIKDLLLENFGVDNVSDGFIKFNKVTGEHNVYTEHPWEVITTTKIPSIAIWTKHTLHDESCTKPRYEISNDNGYVSEVEGVGIKKDRIIISILDERPDFVLEKADRISPFISNLKSIDIYTEDEDGFRETGDIHYLYDSWIKSKDYPFQLDIVFDVIYYVYKETNSYLIDEIQADIETEILPVEEDEEPIEEIETTTTIIQTDTGFRVRINKV